MNYIKKLITGEKVYLSSKFLVIKYNPCIKKWQGIFRFFYLQIMMNKIINKQRQIGVKKEMGNLRKVNLNYIFGPVPSRRLGFSLGVDIVPFKTCTLDCVYCQLGRTTRKTVKRGGFVAPKDILPELSYALHQRQSIDYITLSGSGEPTLNSNIGEIINANLLIEKE